jgi:Uma2 family endonuclease
MAEVQTPAILTGDDLLELSSGMGERYELIDGELITMAAAGFQHGVIGLTIGTLLRIFVSQHKLGRVCAAETGFYTRGNKKTVRAADVAFISYIKLTADSSPTGYLSIAPELVVEVVSPNDKASEIEQKTKEWLDFGVDLVWVVYPESERVHVHSKSRTFHVLEGNETLDGGDVLPGFETPISTFFQS